MSSDQLANLIRKHLDTIVGLDPETIQVTFNLAHMSDISVEAVFTGATIRVAPEADNE